MAQRFLAAIDSLFLPSDERPRRLGDCAFTGGFFGATEDACRLTKSCALTTAAFAESSNSRRPPSSVGYLSIKFVIKDSTLVNRFTAFFAFIVLLYHWFPSYADLFSVRLLP